MQVWYLDVSGNYFDALGIRPYLGRFIHPSDERGPGSAPYIVLAYAYWHSHFHDDRGVVGRKVQLNKHPYTIIGIAPPGFEGTLMFFHPAFFAPIANRDADDLNARGSRWVDQQIGHLKAGVTPAQVDRRFKLDWLLSRKDLSERRRPNDLYLGASMAIWRLPCPSGPCLPRQLDAAGGADSAGRLRQPGKLVCRATPRIARGKSRCASPWGQDACAFCGNCSPKPC